MRKKYWLIGGLIILIGLVAGVTLLTLSRQTKTRPTPPPDVPADTVLVSLDPTKPGQAISPYIYGLADTDPADPQYSSKLRPTLIRWGGNPATRYNWVLGNAWNAGRDWEFRNTNYNSTNGPAEVAADFGTTLKNGAQIQLTIPTLGWVAKNSNQKVASQNVPAEGGSPIAPGSEAIQGYDPQANRDLTSLPSLARKNGPFSDRPDPKNTTIYQDEWVAYLVKRLGSANAGGIKFYAMDNEPDLWATTHTDVHPTRAGYDEVLAKFTEYAAAVKDVDKSAQITGPVSWGWQGYFYSDLDRGQDNFKTAADRHNHGDMPFLPWFLQQLKAYEQKNGRRILDVLDIHYYPQAKGVFDEAKTDPETAALRLRSTRALWDSSYNDESWIKTPIQLIPRMQEWINTYYPGTKLAISEWNFGADNTLNGALAISHALGIFGREGVYMAAYWRYPPANSPGFYAFKLYTNFDDQGSTFGDKSLPVQNWDDEKIGSYAALDSKSGRIRLILVNNQPETAQKVRVQLPSALPAQEAKVYRLSTETKQRLERQPNLALAKTDRLELLLPAYSVTLYDLQP